MFLRMETAAFQPPVLRKLPPFEGSEGLRTNMHFSCLPGLNFQSLGRMNWICVNRSVNNAYSVPIPPVSIENLCPHSKQHQVKH